MCQLYNREEGEGRGVLLKGLFSISWRMSCEGVKTRPWRRVKAEYQFKFMGDISDGYWEGLCNLSLKFGQ